jgi:hypothetical protein
VTTTRLLRPASLAHAVALLDVERGRWRGRDSESECSQRKHRFAPRHVAEVTAREAFSRDVHRHQRGCNGRNTDGRNTIETPAVYLKLKLAMEQEQGGSSSRQMTAIVAPVDLQVTAMGATVGHPTRLGVLLATPSATNFACGGSINMKLLPKITINEGKRLPTVLSFQLDCKQVGDIKSLAKQSGHRPTSPLHPSCSCCRAPRELL